MASRLDSFFEGKPSRQPDPDPLRSIHAPETDPQTRLEQVQNAIGGRILGLLVTLHRAANLYPELREVFEASINSDPQLIQLTRNIQNDTVVREFLIAVEEGFRQSTLSQVNSAELPALMNEEQRMIEIVLSSKS